MTMTDEQVLTPRCKLCDSVENLRLPAQGWVDTCHLPDIMCTPCFREWYDGDLNKRLRELGKPEVRFK